MSLLDELEQLIQEQNTTDDKVRLYYTGEIKRESFTYSGQKGWCAEAPSIPGASVITMRHFPGCRFFKVDSMRRAISLRDLIQAEVLQLDKKPPASGQPSYDQL